jgi:Sulfotransferase domain
MKRLLSAARRVAPRPVRIGAREAFRAIGYITGPQRQLPDFLIIGTKRGGTTSLFKYLIQHPEVAPIFPSVQGIKDVRFFDSNFGKGAVWYRSHFPLRLHRLYAERVRKRRLVAGESTPYYLFHPHAAGRAHQVVPHARIIVLLRNPVDRAYSHYKDEVKTGRETLTFEEATQREPVRLRSEWERILEDPSYYSFELEHHSYLAHGIYEDQLKRWLSAFSPDQVAIFRSEDFYADPANVYRQVLTFLGLAPWELPAYERHNFLPSADMNARTREELTRYFAAPNRRLHELLGFDLGWDREPAALAEPLRHFDERAGGTRGGPSTGVRSTARKEPS